MYANYFSIFFMSDGEEFHPVLDSLDSLYSESRTTKRIKPGLILFRSGLHIKTRRYLTTSPSTYLPFPSFPLFMVMKFIGTSFFTLGVPR